MGIRALGLGVRVDDKIAADKDSLFGGADEEDAEGSAVHGDPDITMNNGPETGESRESQETRRER